MGKDFQQKDGSGALFKNTKKTAEGQPDYIGSITVNGKQHQLGAWLKTSQKGVKYMSLSISDFVRKDAPPKPAPASQTGGNDEPNDDLPPF